MAHRGVVLLFGTFNPFTNAHLNIGVLAKEKYPDYDIFYVPAKAHFMTSYKGLSDSNIFPEEKRLECIRGAVSDFADFDVSDIEIKGLVDGKSINTVDYFKKVLNYTDVVLCFGTDKVNELEDWYRGRELVRDNKFLIVTRDGDSLSDVMTEYTNKYRDNFTEISNDLYSNVSGTKVRQAIAEGDLAFVRAAVPEYVYNILTVKEV